MKSNPFKDVRRKAGATQIEWSLKIGIGLSIVVAIERGDARRCKMLKPSTVRAIADGYGMEWSEASSVLESFSKKGKAHASRQ